MCKLLLLCVKSMIMFMLENNMCVFVSFVGNHSYSLVVSHSKI